MSEQSAKPYLIRAICEWCADNGLTPYLAVKVNAQTRVPVAHVKNGEIVLNISRGATRRLTIDNDWVRFAARFNGASQEVAVPIGAVSGIFAKESGYGFAFTVPDRSGRLARGCDRARDHCGHRQLIAERQAAQPAEASAGCKIARSRSAGPA